MSGCNATRTRALWAASMPAVGADHSATSLKSLSAAWLRWAHDRARGPLTHGARRDVHAQQPCARGTLAYADARARARSTFART
eukprot:4760764-Pleurochrysis_carterae.AAC.1